MLLRALVVGAFCAGLLSACAAVDPVDNRYDNISRSWAQARNESIFLNLIRASYDDPLSFTTVSNVTPTMTNVTGFALPSFSIGPPNCLPTFGATGVITQRACSFVTGVPGAATGFGNTTANNSTSVSSNFSISTQETTAFYTGFLKPIDLLTLSYFIRQGYPAELLFWLFADSFQLVDPHSPQTPLGYHYAPPDSYGCPKTDPAHRCFREWVWIALLAGLTVEEKTIVTKFQSKWDSTTIARFCFSYDAARQAENEMDPNLVTHIRQKYMQHFTPPSPPCGSHWGDPKDQESLLTVPISDTFDFNVSGMKFRVVPRSAYGVFEFLGNQMRMQRDNVGPTPGKAFYWAPPWSPPLGEADETVVPPVLRTVTGQPPLIAVVPAGQGDCFVHTWYLHSDFCVPEDAATTKRIVSLLAQLIAIQTQASDLAITPVVRVIQ
jgi:hypothetical protein